MIKTILIENNENSKKMISSYLKNIENIDFICSFDDFNSLNNENLKDIDLVVFDINSKNLEEILKKVSSFKKDFENLNFIATSYEINSSLVVKVLAANVKDFLLKPLIENILRASIEKIKTKKEEKKAKIFSIFSSKGGVGKTSLALNLAYDISDYTKEKTCLLDLNLNSDSLSFLSLNSNFDINNLIHNFEKMNDNELLNHFTHYQNSNLYFLNFNCNFNQNFNLTTSSIIKAINVLKKVFSYVIIDTNSILDEKNAEIFNLSDLILFIGLHNITSIKMSGKFFEMLNKTDFKTDKIKFILNRSLKNAEINYKDIEEIIKKPVFYEIPNNYLTLIDAINSAKLVLETNPNSNISKAYYSLAQKLVEYSRLLLNEENINHGFLNLIQRMGE